MAQQHFFQIHAIDNFLQLHKACHVEVVESLVPKCMSFIRRICHIRNLLLNINVEKIEVLLPSWELKTNNIFNTPTL
jgi:hypothetical protein